MNLKTTLTILLCSILTSCVQTPHKRATKESYFMVMSGQYGCSTIASYFSNLDSIYTRISPEKAHEVIAAKNEILEEYRKGLLRLNNSSTQSDVLEAQTLMKVMCLVMKDHVTKVGIKEEKLNREQKFDWIITQLASVKSDNCNIMKLWNEQQEALDQNYKAKLIEKLKSGTTKVRYTSQEELVENVSSIQYSHPESQRTQEQIENIIIALPEILKANQCEPAKQKINQLLKLQEERWKIVLENT